MELTNLFAKVPVPSYSSIPSENEVDLEWPPARVRYIMLENSSIMLLSVTPKNLVLWAGQV